MSEAGTSVIDPVCGMTIDRGDAIRVEHEGNACYFCDPACAGIFRDEPACPNHPAARMLLAEILRALAPGATVHEIDPTDPEIARRHRFPGSPTIRIDGRDVDPTYRDPGGLHAPLSSLPDP